MPSETPPKPGKSVTQLRLDELLFEKLKVLARQEMRSFNAQIEYFLMTSVKEYEAKHGKLQSPEIFIVEREYRSEEEAEWQGI